MIPKKIHYCWFGSNPLPPKAQKCIDSWKKYCPDYEIIEWNEENSQKYFNDYTKMCMREKKYAFLTDYLRLLIIYEYGGIYFDTDVELVKSFDDIIDNQAFFGFETKEYVNTGVGFGAVENNKVVKNMIDEYNYLLDGLHGFVGCPILNTNALKKRGLLLNGEKQVVDGATIYPIDYFNPYDDLTGVLTKTSNTFSIHWYSKSWMNRRSILRSKISKPLHKLFGIDFMRRKNE